MALELVTVQVGGRTYSDLDSAFLALDRALVTQFQKATIKIEKELLNTINRVVAKLAKKHSRPWSGLAYNPGDSLFKRSGYGLRSIMNSVSSTGGLNPSATMRITGYMVDHEEGAVIKSKGGKYLAIPLPDALSQSGELLRPRPSDYENTFVTTSKKGHLLIFQRHAVGIRPLYLLKKQIKIRPRLGAAKIVNDELPYFERKVLDALDRELA